MHKVMHYPDQARVLHQERTSAGMSTPGPDGTLGLIHLCGWAGWEVWDWDWD